jgi:hypothetical protein
MGQVLLTIPDDEITKFLSFVKKLNPEIKILSLKRKKEIEDTSSENKNTDFAELFGIWENSNVTLEKIREKAWPIKTI